MTQFIFSKKAWFFHAFFIFSINIIAQSPVWTEYFEYPMGDEIGNHGWIFENYNPYLKVCPGLTFKGYAGSGIGNGLQIEEENKNAARHRFPQISEGCVYVSFLVQFNSNLKSQYFFTLWDGNMPSWAGGTDTKFAFNGRIYAENNANFDSKLNIGLSFHDNAKAVYTTDKPVTIGETYLLVIKYEIIPGDNNDKVSLFLLDHVLNKEPNEPLLGPLSDNASNGDIFPAGLMFRPSHTGQDIVVDGIRVGTTWESVISTASSGMSETITENNTLQINKDAQHIIITLPKKEEINVYAINGSLVLSVKGNQGKNRIPVFNKGVYIVTAGQRKGVIIF